MRRAANDAISFVEGMDFEMFLKDTRTQHAVAMALLIIGEKASKLARRNPSLFASHPDVPWSEVAGMRNRIAHGYTEIDFRVVWDTLTDSLPEFLRTLPK